MLPESLTGVSARFKEDFDDVAKTMLGDIAKRGESMIRLWNIDFRMERRAFAELLQDSEILAWMQGRVPPGISVEVFPGCGRTWRMDPGDCLDDLAFIVLRNAGRVTM